MNSEVLNSWKEVAAYLGRGVRTVQRWEHDLALPVRRPRGKERSAVIALKPVLDRWLHEVPQGLLENHKPDPLRHKNLQLATEQLLKHTHEILEQSTKIQQMVRGTMALTIQLKARQAERLRRQPERSGAQHFIVTQTSRAVSNVPQLHSQAAEQKIGSRAEMIPATKISALR
jgi:hypothetical protein